MRSFLARSLASVAACAWSAAAPVDLEGVIDLTVADPDLSTPELIVDRAVAALRAGDTRYTETAGRPHLRRAIAERHEQLSGRPTVVDNVLLALGAQCALYLALRSIADPGDHLVAIEPYYLSCPASLAAIGAEVGFIRTDPDRAFCVTAEGSLQRSGRTPKQSCFPIQTSRAGGDCSVTRCSRSRRGASSATSCSSAAKSMATCPTGILGDRCNTETLFRLHRAA